MMALRVVKLSEIDEFLYAERDAAEYDTWAPLDLMGHFLKVSNEYSGLIKKRSSQSYKDLHLEKRRIELELLRRMKVGNYGV